MKLTIGTILLAGAVVVIAILVVRFWAQIVKFLSETAVELKKVSWSTRSELVDSTWVVLISSAILGVFIGVVDFGLSKFLGLIVR